MQSCIYSASNSKPVPVVSALSEDMCVPSVRQLFDPVKTTLSTQRMAFAVRVLPVAQERRSHVACRSSQHGHGQDAAKAVPVECTSGHVGTGMHQRTSKISRLPIDAAASGPGQRLMDDEVAAKRS